MHLRILLVSLMCCVLCRCFVPSAAWGELWAEPISVRLIGFNSPSAEVESLLPDTPDKKTRNTKDGAEIVFIPAGRFRLGFDGRGESGTDQYKSLYDKSLYVEVSGYYLYKHPVTVRQYRRYCKAVSKEFPDYRRPDWGWNDDHPMVNVSWKEAREYCLWAGGDLPTEAQWEKAACWDDKAHRAYAYPWGGEYDLRKLWASRERIGDAGGTIEVGKFGVSPYGLTDMAGNVWQWCRDWYDADFWGGRAAERLDPVNTSVGEKKHRVLKGGSWMQFKHFNFRSQNRMYRDPTQPLHNIGFRCALPVETE